MKDMADMIANIYKVGVFTYPKVFQCDNSSEFKAEVTKMLEKHGVMVRHTTIKYKHTQMAFVEALSKLLAETLFNNPGKVLSTWLKHLYGWWTDLMTWKPR